MSDQTKQCYLFHSWTDWEDIKNPDQYTTSAMYKAGLKPTQIRCCSDCGETQIKLEKWEGQ